MLDPLRRDGANAVKHDEREEGIAVMAEANTNEMARILVPFDGTPQAETAVPYAAALAAPGTTIVFCTVYPARDGGDSVTDPEIDARISALSRDLQAAGKTVVAETYYGDPRRRPTAARN
jgi:nucleotide-binding universal stress UspA family protein